MIPIAIYHLSIKIVSRGGGKSAVAAYRSGTLIKDERSGETHDYTHKKGIAYTEIILPANAPPEYSERAVLWNDVEKSERYVTAQLTREIEIALPAELTIEQNIALARRYVNEQFVAAGMCADLCVHDKWDGNPHAHVLLTMRPLNEDGTWGAKSRTVDGKKVPTVDWNEHSKAEDWRKAWAAYCNTALRANGHESNIDWRSYKRQGEEQIPTVHLGPYASGLEKRGITTELGDKNRAINATNAKLRQINARLKKLEAWKVDIITAPPTLYEVFAAMTDSTNLRYNSQKIANIKKMSQLMLFFDKYGIETVADMNRVVSEMRGNFNAVSDSLKKTERRLETLGEHIKHSDNFKAYRGYKAKYDKLYAEYQTAKKSTGLFADKKAQKALDAANEYYREHRAEITFYDAAEKYLKGVLQSRYDSKKLPPITAWKKEQSDKTTERAALYRDYEKLKDETRNIEEMKRTVEQIMREQEPEQERQSERKWSHGMEL